MRPIFGIALCPIIPIMEMNMHMQGIGKRHIDL